MTVTSPLVPTHSGLPANEVSRRSRLCLVPELGLDGLRRLQHARVLVIGARGIGATALEHLARTGVGTLGVIDDEFLAEWDLPWQGVHRPNGVGARIAESARVEIMAINTAVSIVTHDEPLRSANALAVLGGYDLVIEAAGDFSTRYLVSDACALLGIPHVWGSAYRFEGYAGVGWAPHGPTYRHLYPQPPAGPGSISSCGVGGIVGSVCATIGSLLATETIKLVTGAGKPLVGRYLVHDGLAMTFRTLQIPWDPEGDGVTKLSDYCGYGRPLSPEVLAAVDGSTITAWDLKSMMHTAEVFCLVDVREPNEAAIVSIPGSVLIPTSEFLAGRGFARLPRDKPIVLYCKVGVRSAQVLSLLKNQGFADAVHLGGGIIEWVDYVDPEMPEY
ncbi:ThiF family adenylyltransferase [Streptomyces sp. NPDC087659]|uniref:ThiF family adenylyltransferase n=1 Tax=Streptomyces sp. NPDC087659 TaxID=3365801 RepID=UPI0038066B22